MKKYVISGSVGHISKLIISGLVKSGNAVSVITSNKDRVKEIASLGAKALVGSLSDATFLTTVLKGADAVYTMIPPMWQTTDWRASQLEVAKSFESALKANGIKYVVNLSSMGAHEPNGIGPVSGLYDFEQLLNKIPGLNVKHLRPSFFFYNFLAQIGLIKQAGIMGGNYGTSEKVFLVHVNDITKAALEELSSLNFYGSGVRYIIGDERSGQEIANVLGKAIGRELNWVEFTDEQQQQGLQSAGLAEPIVNGYVEMGNALRNGIMQADARKNKPALSAIKLEEFAKEFAAAFNA
jgi:uncharacterized protein YbjT (DUF2867 family)